MRAKKRNLKPVPKITASERQNALRVGKLMADGIDPFAVTEHSIGGSFRFHVRDMAAYFELTGKKYDVVHSNFNMVEENDTYVRRLK